MGRRREAGRHPVIDDAHPALAVATADLVDCERIQEPKWLPIVGCQYEAAVPGLVIRIHLRSWVLWPSLGWRRPRLAAGAAL
jgi:hypothetical protein